MLFTRKSPFQLNYRRATFFRLRQAFLYALVLTIDELRKFNCKSKTKHFHLSLPSICNYYNFSLLLHLNWFRTTLPAGRMKRESGGNPEQSRCCEAPSEVPIQLLHGPLPAAAACSSADSCRREGIGTEESVRRPAIHERPSLLVG